MEDWKDILGNIGYSTNPELNKKEDNELHEPKIVDKTKQNLIIETDAKKRRGKIATIITGFEGSNDELEKLAKILKIKCGVGGSARGGEILIQGDVKYKVFEILKKEGYAKTKLIQ